MKKTLILTGAAAMLMAGAAVAQQSERQGRWGGSDARISQAEFVERHVSRLQAMDADNDGVVTVAERTAFGQAHRAERMEGRFARLDANGDGMISRAEFDAAHEQRRADRGERRGWRGMAGHRAPRQGMGAARTQGDIVIADARARAAERFAALDTNGDGYVTADERRAMMGERRGRRMAQPPAASE